MNEKSIDEIVIEVKPNKFMVNHCTIKQLYDRQPKENDWLLCKCDTRIHRSNWKTHFLKCYTIIHEKN